MHAHRQCGSIHMLMFQNAQTAMRNLVFATREGHFDMRQFVIPSFSLWILVRSFLTGNR